MGEKKKKVGGEVGNRDAGPTLRVLDSIGLGCGLWSFPTSSLANHHKQWFKQDKSIILDPWGQKLKVNLMGLKSRCWQGWVPCEGFRGDASPLSVPTSRVHLHSLASGSFFHLQSQELHHTNLLSSYLLLWPWLACLSLSLIRTYV